MSNLQVGVTPCFLSLNLRSHSTVPVFHLSSRLQVSEGGELPTFD